RCVMAANGLVCVGKFAGAHGVKGQVKLQSFTADPKAVAAYSPLSDETGKRHFKIKITGTNKDMLLVSIEGLTDRDQAAALNGTMLYAPRSAFPSLTEGEFYQADLMGLTAKDTNGNILGKVLALHDYGGGLILEINDTLMLP